MAFTELAASPALALPVAGMGVFLMELGSVVATNTDMFTKKYGRAHRVMGAMYLLVLVVAFVDLAAGFIGTPSDRYTFDVIMGVCGTLTALTAAYDFRKAHQRAKTTTDASGALDADKTVTTDEMVEHAFYQMLNLAQVMFLHACGAERSMWRRLAYSAAATATSLFRGDIPVNSFSDNYAAADGAKNPGSATSWLYWVKKHQYVFYKHFLLHGLNVSVAVAGGDVVGTPAFRCYWLALNAAYVMEFFLQTLVKKGYMGQARMLRMNASLMAASTLAALPVLARVCLPAAAVSLILNYTNRHCGVRGHEMRNTAVAAAVAMWCCGGPVAAAAAPLLGLAMVYTTIISIDTAGCVFSMQHAGKK